MTEGELFRRLSEAFNDFVLEQTDGETVPLSAVLAAYSTLVSVLTVVDGTLQRLAVPEDMLSFARSKGAEVGEQLSNVKPVVH